MLTAVLSMKRRHLLQFCLHGQRGQRGQCVRNVLNCSFFSFLQAIAARALVERGYVVFSATTQWDPESKDKKGGKIMRPPSNWPETTLANCLSQYFDPH